VSERLALDPTQVSLLVSGTYQADEWHRGSITRNPDTQLSERTAAWLAGTGQPAPSVMVIPVSADIKDTYDAMRWAGDRGRLRRRHPRRDVAGARRLRRAA
jgi:hypothetical protein